jgi:cyclopropane fatty-acyl-phospholipid synthase-like methyltransferase
MELNPYEIKDHCRSKLTKYLIQAVSCLPNFSNPLILDIGCGSGVPSLILSQYFNCTVYAVDINEEAINVLKKNAAGKGLSDKIKTINKSVYEMDFAGTLFDIVIAEGLLNIIGFEPGLLLSGKYLKNKGHLIIHDEYIKHDRKTALIKEYGYKIINSVILDEYVWWIDYYKCLEDMLLQLDDETRLTIFRNELEEIKQYKENPSSFRSVYYVLEQDSGAVNV